MASTLYTQLLLAEYLSADGAVTVTVPDGQLWVVRDIVASFASTGDTAALNVEDDVGVTIAFLQPTPGFNMVHWEGRQAIAQGHELVAVAGPIAVSVRITGYAFSQ
jgi:hypothetical protein